MSISPRQERNVASTHACYRMASEALFLCVASHHSGLICDRFWNRRNSDLNILSSLGRSRSKYEAHYDPAHSKSDKCGFQSTGDARFKCVDLPLMIIIYAVAPVLPGIAMLFCARLAPNSACSHNRQI